MITTWRHRLSRASVRTCAAAGLAGLPACGDGQATHGSSDLDGSTSSDASRSRDGADDGSSIRLDGSGGDAASDGDHVPTDGGGSDGRDDDSGTTDGGGVLTDAGCTVLSASGFAGQARSTGFAGMPSAYDALYGIPCTIAADCVPSCVDAGGTSASCSIGSLCLPDLCPDGGDGCPSCLPPTYWLDVSGALGRPDSGAGGNPADDNQAFDNGYNDTLQLTGFGLTVPSSATIRGIAFDVDREADDPQATDDSVRILAGSTPTGADHASSASWPMFFTTIRYGGPTDTWGVAWTPADVTASGFGIGLTPKYLSTAGNDHVDVDSVGATVYYTMPPCP